MRELNLPKYSFRIKKGKDDRDYIFDPLRKKEIVLTPEEWVRQNILHFLVQEKNYPASLISIEAGIKVNTLARRYDALVYARSGSPVLLLECKAPEVAINQKTFDQIIAYNQSVKAAYLLVTNGLKHFCCKENLTTRTYDFLQEIPEFDTL